MSTIFTALSGLQAQAKRLEVSANNVVNAQSLGFKRAADGSDNGGFQPKQIQHASLPGGGVVAKTMSVSPVSVLAYQPRHSQADANGLVPRPNVDLSQEFVSQILAQRAYEASARLIAEEAERLRELTNLSS